MHFLLKMHEILEFYEKYLYEKDYVIFQIMKNIEQTLHFYN
jgi:hypothetical protein